MKTYFSAASGKFWFFICLAGINFHSCISPRNQRNNAYNKLKDVSIRLIVKHAEDSFYVWDPSRVNTRPGTLVNKLETVSRLDTSFRTGVAIRFRGHSVRQTFYHSGYACNGLMHKISDLRIFFKRDTLTYDITHLLRGDKNIESYLWRKYDTKHPGYSNILGKDQGYANPYFSNIADFCKVVNAHGDSLGADIFEYEYIFWLDKQAVRELPFKPDGLSIQMDLVNKRGRKRGRLTDIVRLRD